MTHSFTPLRNSSNMSVKLCVPFCLGILAVSRAIGDINLKPYVSCDPEFIEKEIVEREDEYVLLASDGLWDVMNNEEVAKFVTRSGRIAL